MSIIQAYKSDSDGKLFEGKPDYLKHLRKLASVRRSKKLREKLNREREAFLSVMGQVNSMDKLNQFIKDNWRWFWQNGAFGGPFVKNQTVPNFHELVDVKLHNVFWVETIRNSHSCPRKGVQNFDPRSEHNKGKPTVYPGWTGRISIKVRTPTYKYKGKEHFSSGWGSDYFHNTIINLGCGGGGSDSNSVSYAYDVKLFAADFPVMYEMIRRKQWIENENQKRKQVWATLGGNTIKMPLVNDVPDDWVCPDPLVSMCPEPLVNMY